MEEEADLGDYIQNVCSCSDVVNALVQQAQLTQAEEQRARAYLNLREKPWPSPKAIEAGAVLYLDELSVSYLQHLRLLAKIHTAGFTAIIPAGEVLMGDNFIRYDALAGRATTLIEDIRRAVDDGVQSGKVVLAPASKSGEDQQNRIAHHPTFEMLETAAIADVVVIDDRYFNQHGLVTGQFGSKPVWTTFDLLTAPKYDAAQQREYRTGMRRAGLCFVPLTPQELTDLVNQASISNDHLVESAELKAVRENMQMVRMSNGLQLPKEALWLDNTVIRAFIETIKSQWHEGMDEAVARARSKWLLALLDIRQWAHRYKVDGHPEVSDVRYRGQILSLALLNAPISAAVKAKYWQWFDEGVLTGVKDEHRELYEAVVAQVRSIIADASERGQGGGDDGE